MTSGSQFCMFLTKPSRSTQFIAKVEDLKKEEIDFWKKTIELAEFAPLLDDNDQKLLSQLSRHIHQIKFCSDELNKTLDYIRSTVDNKVSGQLENKTTKKKNPSDIVCSTKNNPSDIVCAPKNNNNITVEPQEPNNTRSTNENGSCIISWILPGCRGRLGPIGRKRKSDSILNEGEIIKNGYSKQCKKAGKCYHCGTTDSPEWRKRPEGANTLCNACGLRFATITKKRKRERESGNRSDIGALSFILNPSDDNGYSSPSEDDVIPTIERTNKKTRLN